MPIPLATSMLLSTLGTSAGEIGTSLLNRKASIINTDKTIKAQKELAQYQYQKDLEMWQKANEYNSPSEQMKRLREANLNPSLLSGSPANTTQALMPKYQAPRVDYDYNLTGGLNIPELLSQIQDIRIKKTQGDILDNEKFISDIKKEVYSWRGWQTEAESDLSKFESNILKNKIFQKFGLELSKSQLDINKQTAREKELNNQLWEEGIAKSDNILLRMLMLNLKKSGIKMPEFGKYQQ